MNMLLPNFQRSLRRSALSMIELLAVVAIIAILAALVIPSMRGMSSATDLKSSASLLVDTINLARQTAVSANRPVEVRFIEVPDANDTALAYRAVVMFVVDDSGSTQEGKITFLRGNVVMSDTDEFGTLLRGLPVAQMPVPTVAQGEKQFNYRYFRFRADGSADLLRTAPVGAGDSWHVMLYDLRTPPNGKTAPANYINLQLFPDTGRTRTFQPGAS